MSTKRYDTNPEKELILEGLEFFISEENPDLVNPKEIKELMDKLELKDKMSLIYNLISELCSNREIIRNGGISKSDFIEFLEKKLNDVETKPGIKTLYHVFSNSEEDTLPMTNFCKTAREIGDSEKDEELKELMKNADVYGKEMNFDEFYEMMKEDDYKKDNNNNYYNLKKDKKNQKHIITKKYIWKKEEKDDSEPQEEKSSKRSSYRNRLNDKENNNTILKNEYEPKNAYSYRRTKIQQTKISNEPLKVEETHEEKIIESVPVEEKKITLEEIITEKKVEVPENNTNNTGTSNVRHRYKYKNRFRRGQKEDDNASNNNIEKSEDTNSINNNIPEENNVETNESKRYHRRYRANNNINNEGKNENNNNIMYSRYRRQAEN